MIYSRYMLVRFAQTSQDSELKSEKKMAHKVEYFVQTLVGGMAFIK